MQCTGFRFDPVLIRQDGGLVLKLFPSQDFIDCQVKLFAMLPIPAVLCTVDTTVKRRKIRPGVTLGHFVCGNEDKLQFLA